MEWKVKVANEDANNEDANKCSNKYPDDKLSNSSNHIKLTVVFVNFFAAINFFCSINIIGSSPQLVDSTKPE